MVRSLLFVVQLRMFFIQVEVALQTKGDIFTPLESNLSQLKIISDEGCTSMMSFNF